MKSLEFGIWNLKILYGFPGYLKIGCIYSCLFFQYGCNGDNVPDCFQNAGELVREEISVPDFTKITVFENVAVILKQGDAQQVEVETGKFLRDEVTVDVQDGTLLLKDTNDCNYVREYGLTTIYVTSPNITEIRSSTGFPIVSDGILAYPQLRLLSESFTSPETDTTDGSFDLQVAGGTVSIVSNGIAFFKLQGSADNLSITIAAGDSRIEAENLIAERVSLNHRGSNDIRVDPQQSLSGVIRGTGDVVSFNRPPEVDVEELFRGKLVFKD